MLTTKQKIDMALAHASMSQAELARRLGQSPANFNNKLLRGTLKEDQLLKIAEILGAEYHSWSLTFSDGTKVGG